MSPPLSCHASGPTSGNTMPHVPNDEPHANEIAKQITEISAGSDHAGSPPCSRVTTIHTGFVRSTFATPARKVAKNVSQPGGNVPSKRARRTPCAPQKT